ncbi:MAG: hypothetical protein ACKO47_04615 [Alphaproteobacteria bacterium]
MKKIEAIATTSGLIVDRKIYIPVSTLLKQLEESCNQLKEKKYSGTPVLISHDHSKMIGWSNLSHILLNDIGYLYVDILISEDRDRLIGLRNKSINDRIKENPNTNKILEIIKMHNIEKSNNSLIENGMLPCFYHKMILKTLMPELPLDKWQMIDYSYLVDNFEISNAGTFRHKQSNIVIFADRNFKKNSHYMNSSNFHFFENLDKFYHKNRDRSKVLLRIDLDVFSYAENLGQCIELEKWWGIPFSGDLSRLPSGVTCHGMGLEESGRTIYDIDRTEFYWYGDDIENKKQIKTLEIEEIKDKSVWLEPDNKEEYIFKYIHTQANQTDKIIIHFDGSVRIYDEVSYKERSGRNLSNTNKDAGYKKLFRIDGIIDIEDWKELVNNYFVNNHLVMEYFENTVSKSSKESEKISSSINSSIEKEINIRVSCKENDSSDISRGSYITSKEDVIEFYNIFDRTDFSSEKDVRIKLIIRNQQFTSVFEFFGIKEKVISLVSNCRNHINTECWPSEFVDKIHNELLNVMKQ